MDIEAARQEIAQRFRERHDARLREIAAEVAGEPGVLNDAARIALAYGHVAVREMGEANALLDGVTGDGSSPLADFHFVRALIRKDAGEHALVVQSLGQYVEDSTATHADLLRITVAESLMALGQHGSVPGALKPMLEPPGTPWTLEAMCLVLEAQFIAEPDNKEALIERVTLIDALIERGFRLSTVEKAVHFARLMEEHRVEPPVGPMLKAHGQALMQYAPAERDDVRFLTVAGGKYRVPEAVHCAARAYVREPFELAGMDPDLVTQLFSSHHEYEAARQVILQHHTASQIRKNPGVWAPLINATYECGMWKEVLELIREHRNEIPGHPAAADMLVARAVSEYQLGRWQEALSSFEANRGAISRAASGGEAAMEVLCHMALGELGKVDLAAQRALAPKLADRDWVGEFFNTMLNELAINRWEEAIDEWLVFLRDHVTNEDYPLKIQRIGEFLFEWSLARNTRSAAALLEEKEAHGRAALLRALASSLEGFEQEMDRHFAAAADKPGDLPAREVRFHKARAMRRFGRSEEALALIEEYLAEEPAARRPAALGIKSGLLRELGRISEIGAVLEDANAFVREHARMPREAAMMSFEMQQFHDGDSAVAALSAARSYLKTQKGNIETLRLARKAAFSFDATDEQRQQAAEVEAAWMKDNRGRG